MDDFFQKVIKKYLKLANASQQDLATHLGITAGALTNKLKGVKPLTRDELKEIILFLVNQEGVTSIEGIDEILKGHKNSRTLFSFQEWQQNPLKQFYTSINKTEKRNNNIPIPFTDIIGREYQIDTIKNLLSGKNRLVTLTGMGGIGKTRLSMAVAEQLVEEFKDGVWWVNLAPITNSDLMLSAIIRSIGLTENPSQTRIELIQEWVEGKQILFVLDNFEQLVASNAPELIAHLLSQTLGLKMLVTSRNVLRLYGEYEFAVTPLALPRFSRLSDMETLVTFAAIELFVERAKASNNRFKLEPANANTIVEICERLDGLPLAIELASARIKFINVNQLLQQMEKLSIGKTLVDGARNLPIRHQSLNQVFDWSYKLLGQVEQNLLAQLSVFRGGISLEALCTVSGLEENIVFKQLNTLIEASWLGLTNLEAEKPLENNSNRYELLQVVREYAEELLEEKGLDHQTKQAHAKFFLALAQRAEPEYKGVNQVAWLDKIELEHNNFRAALTWSLENNIEITLELGAALARFWQTRGYILEGYNWLEQTINKSEQLKEVDKLIKTKAIQKMALLSLYKGDFELSKNLYSQCVKYYEKENFKQGLAESFKGLGVLAYYDDEYDKALDYYEKGLVYQRQLSDEQGLDDFLSNLAVLSFQQGKFGYAIKLTNETLILRQKIGYKKGLADSLVNLSYMLCVNGKATEALEKGLQSLDIAKEVGYSQDIALSYEAIARCYHDLGNLEQALQIITLGDEVAKTNGSRFLIESISIVRAQIFLSCGKVTESKELVHEMLLRTVSQKSLDMNLAFTLIFDKILLYTKDSINAAKVFGIIQTIKANIKFVITPRDMKKLEELREQIQAELVNADEWIIQGQQLTLEQGIEYLLELIEQEKIRV